MRFLRMTFLICSFAPVSLLAFTLSRRGWDQIAPGALSLMTSLLLTFIGFFWYMIISSYDKKAARSVVFGTWLASVPLLLVAAAFGISFVYQFIFQN